MPLIVCRRLTPVRLPPHTHPLYHVILVVPAIPPCLQVPKGRITKEDVFCPVFRAQVLKRKLPLAYSLLALCE